ncbi:division/cell wall cluster transcriptional repressor MraZ [Sediminibacterium goheungense]|nr:division/cell wall cluster transcriptional repressor MraZ [Sediminibacterium goheungense]
MSTSGNLKNIYSPMTGFHGEYEATVDAKGRFLLPGGLKKQLPEGESRFILSRGFEKCLTLYPLKSWEIIIAKISQLNDFDPKVRQFRRQFLGGATEIELDNAGRMLLPASLKEFAGLSKDIVLAAALDRFEIWDAGKYKQLFEDFSPEAFSSLAQEVMTEKI